ncbi:CAP domain-containing protein [Haliangium sp.]|uniref:CAP domain-containing protein n=1 Tax=Haliangium sp. TaxID=2663208 RepID=UPI003D0F23B4
MSALERGIVVETNRLRRDPRGYAAVLKRWRGYYDGPFLRLPGQVALQTFEGVAAVDEAIAVARRTEAIPVLEVSAGLSRAARRHAEEIGRAGTIDHRGADGSGPFDRMRRHGEVFGMSGENIGTGHDVAAHMVVDLFVDDGVASRGHRDNLLEGRFRIVGVGCAPHRHYGTVCVFDFAESFEAR